MFKKAYLQVQRGLVANTLNVDGQSYNVNEGYLKPALMGFGLGTVAHSIISLLKEQKVGLKQSLIAGTIGSGVSIGIAEIKRRKIQSILNQDENSAKRLAQRGFSIKSRVMENAPNISGLAEEVLKESALNEAEMSRELDRTEDDAHSANAILEASGTLGLVANLRSKSSVSPRDAYRVVNKSLVDIPKNRLLRGASKANVIYSVMADKDNTLADASAGAQFAMYVPRVVDDTIAAVRHGRKDKGSILRNTAFTLARSAPGLAPIVGRALKKKYSDS